MVRDSACVIIIVRISVRIRLKRDGVANARKQEFPQTFLENKDSKRGSRGGFTPAPFANEDASSQEWRSTDD